MEGIRFPFTRPQTQDPKEECWQNLLKLFPSIGKKCISGARLPKLEVPPLGFQPVMRFMAVSTVTAMHQLYNSPIACRKLFAILRNNGAKFSNYSTIQDILEGIGIKACFYDSGLLGIHSISVPRGMAYGSEISDFKNAEAWGKEDYPELFQAAPDHRPE